MNCIISRDYIIDPFSYILIFLILTDLSIFLNISFVRQFLGFIFLALIPGFLFLCILKQDKLGLLDIFILSIGLSISIIMFIGIIINIIYPFFGYDTPLSPISLLISFNIAIFILAVITQLVGGFANIAERSYAKLDSRNHVFLFIPLLFPILSIIGIYLMNTNENNIIILLLLFLIPSYAIFISLQHKLVSENIFPIIIFLSSISIILLWAMRSSHIIGTDVNLEYILFKHTLFNEKWQILENSTIDSCLSISILPVVYQSFLNVNIEYLFKILYPLLFSISPLIIYHISKEYVSDIYAYLASIFFMSQSFFIITTASPRTNIAILFFALYIMVLLHNTISEFNKKILLILFIISCVFSHYSTTYIFFSMLTILFIVNKIAFFNIIRFKKLDIDIISSITNTNRIDSWDYLSASNYLKSKITIGMLGLFIIFIFFWYSQITGAAFKDGIRFIAETIDSMQFFFLAEARDSGISAAFGSGLNEKPLLSKIIFIICWLPNILILIGIFDIAFKYHQRDALPYKNINVLSDFLYKKLDQNYFFLGLISFFILIITVALPYISKGYDLERVILQMMVVLSSFLVFGGLKLAQVARINKSYLIILLVVLPYFILNTGALHGILGIPNDVVLASKGISYDLFYVQEQDAYACKWLGETMRTGINIYSDAGGRRRLLRQGDIDLKYLSDLAKFIDEIRKIHGYIYLKYSNVIGGKLVSNKGNVYIDLAKYKLIIYNYDMIYNNGGSEIWQKN